uniref:Uncharacterized protein n=1 Tax=Arundo donax TaxID=35708 RepID=A0A0A9ADI5_ARUDO
MQKYSTCFYNCFDQLKRNFCRNFRFDQFVEQKFRSLEQE